ncbi:MAG: aminopeptidase N, partial [Gammaproteobacteria bacterium]
MKEGSPETIYLKDYSPSAFLIDEVRLRFELGEDVTVVHSRLALRRNRQAKSDGDALILDGRELELDSVAIGGKPLAANRYRVDDESLTIEGVPDQFELDVVTRIKPQDNTSLEGLYKSSGKYCTQCEAQGFRKITYFLDRPDVMARYTTTIVADKDRYPVLLSNGNPIAREDLDGNLHTVTWRDPFPKPSYLFALVAGDLLCNEDRYTTRSGREVALRFYVQAHNADRTAHATAALKKAMRWDEDRFSLEYDLDIYMIVAVDDFNMGAMENKGLNIFNSKYVLAKPETATDSDYRGIEGVIAHEYFHNWTGNRVTCRDWFQLSLKEGLTVFRDQEFTGDVTSHAVKRIDDVRTLRTLQFAEDAGPMAHPVRPASYIEINNFYTVTVYEKGAEVVRMYQTLFGRDGFRKGMDLYFERHDGQAVTTDDFAAAMADANGEDLAQFKRWYEQAGTPELRVSGEWNADAQTYRLHIAQYNPPTQGQDEKLPLRIPCATALLGADGKNFPLQLAGENEPQGAERVLDVSGAEQEFTFINITEKPVPSLLRGFSAPVKLDYGYTDEELAFLLAHDSDSFNRWDAGQRLSIKIMLGLIEDKREGRALRLNDAFVAAIGSTLSTADLDMALIAAAVTLPSENYLAELMDEVDVDAIHAVKEFMQQQLARGLETQMLELYESSAAT